MSVRKASKRRLASTNVTGQFTTKNSARKCFRINECRMALHAESGPKQATRALKVVGNEALWHDFVEFSDGE
jgi:hypothetical protein